MDEKIKDHCCTALRQGTKSTGRSLCVGEPAVRHQIICLNINVP